MDALRAKSRLPVAYEQADWPRVEYLAEQVLAAAPRDASAHFMLGVACAERQQPERAASALAEACRLAPDRADYLANHARALTLAARYAEARTVADRSLALGPEDPSTLAMLGVTYLEANAVEAAVAALRAAVVHAPGRPPLHFLLAQALTGLGDTAAAEGELENCIRLQPAFWPAHLRLSMLRKQGPDANHRDRLRALLAGPAADPHAQQMFLHLALAKENEDLEDYDAAYRHYVQGKAAARAGRPPSSERDAAMFDALIRYFPDSDPVPAAADPPAAPIFIVGMPRTGTTLLDRMLSNHPEVMSAGEIRNFPAALQRASGSAINILSQADIGEHVRRVDWPRLGETYVQSTRPATADAVRFIDKLPHNFLYAGFIARALPGARILCLRRDPLDTCLGSFRHLFELASGYYDYSLDLLDTGRYYLGFDRLVAHWRRVLPGHLLEVRYEALVEQPEPTLRSVLEFCGLPWHDAVLHPETNTTPVRTPSAWQVRGALYRSAIGSWRHYEKQLQPLRALLEGAGVRLPA